MEVVFTKGPQTTHSDHGRYMGPTAHSRIAPLYPTDEVKRTLDLALEHDAVVVTPDYRLMPESQFPDMVEDLRDFWHWVDSDLERLLDHNVDTRNVAIVGESAGGYLSAQSVLLGFSKHAAVVMLQYPALAIRRHLAFVQNAPGDRQALVASLDEYIAKMEPGSVLTRAKFSTRMDLALGSMQSNRLVDLDKYPDLDPITSVETAERIPPIFLFHGVDDTSVGFGDSQAWAEKLEKLRPDVPIHAVFPPGEHVLDKFDTLKAPWLSEPIAFVRQYWPVK
jgi:acetyl esterase/lipase